VVTRWPPYCSPGWLAAYALGLLAWLAIWHLWGACLVVAMIAGGLFGTIAIADWLHETNRPSALRPPEKQ
jgi:hypothetical protein